MGLSENSVPLHPMVNDHYTPFSDIPICFFWGNFIVPFLERQPLLNASWNLAAHIAVCICLCPLPRTFPLRSAMQIDICQGAVVLQALQTMSLCSIQISKFFPFFLQSFSVPCQLHTPTPWCELYSPAAQLPHPPRSHLEGLSESIHTARIRDELDPLHASRTLKGTLQYVNLDLNNF